jgi:hypothetical protein
MKLAHLLMLLTSVCIFSLVTIGVVASVLIPVPAPGITPRCTPATICTTGTINAASDGYPSLALSHFNDTFDNAGAFAGILSCDEPGEEPVITVAATGSPKMTGRIDWKYTRTDTFNGQVTTQTINGYTVASLAKVDGLWLDDGSSVITATASVVGPTFAVTCSAKNALYTDMRDFLANQGWMSSWVYGMPYGPNPWDRSTIIFKIHPGSATPGMPNIVCSGGEGCPLTPPGSLGFNPTAGDFLGKIVGSWFDPVPTVDFNRDIDFCCVGGFGGQKEHLTVHGILAGSAAPVAEAGGPYDVVRAGSASLDGTGSTGDLVRYAWTFTPGPNCPPGTTLIPSTLSGSQVMVVPLCDLVATLTVTDTVGRSSTDTAPIWVSVRPFSPALITHEEQLWTAKKLDKLTPQGEIIPPSLPGQDWVGNTAINRSKCSMETLSILCPYVPEPFTENTRLGKGYTLARVNNAGGPFEGFYYVSSGTMSIRRIALFNPYILPAGKKWQGARESFYQHNKNAGRDITGFLRLTSLHEGEGIPGLPGTGHTGALRAKIDSDPDNFDPNIAIESLWGPSQQQAQVLVDFVLSGIQLQLHRASQDNLPVIWGPKPLEFWVGKKWIPVMVTVPAK